MKYIIGNASLNDIENIRVLIYNRCDWFEKNNIIGWTKNYYNRYDYNYFKKQLKENDLFVIKENGEVCGAMLLKNVDSDYWQDDGKSYYIHHLVTDIDKKGLGKELLDFAIKKCRKSGKEYLRLDCFKNSIFLNNYYEKYGFEKVGSGNIDSYYYNLWELKIK